MYPVHWWLLGEHGSKWSDVRKLNRKRSLKSFVQFIIVFFDTRICKLKSSRLSFPAHDDTGCDTNHRASSSKSIKKVSLRAVEEVLLRSNTLIVQISHEIRYWATLELLSLTIIPEAVKMNLVSRLCSSHYVQKSNHVVDLQHLHSWTHHQFSFWVSSYFSRMYRNRHQRKQKGACSNVWFGE